MVTVHENAALLEVDDPHLMEEILHLPAVANAVVVRLSDRAVLLDPRRADAILGVLTKEGHLPQVVESNV